MALLQPWRYARCIPHVQRSLKVINKVRANIQPKKRPGSTLHAPCEDVPDFGDYSVILPPEPFVFGVSHFKPRPVPPHIPKPPYADFSKIAENEADKYEGGGGLRGGKRERIALGGESEFRIREAAKLAKKVRVYAGSLAQVCVFVHLMHIVRVLTVGPNLGEEHERLA
jgi:methionyl aminopeptidase